MSPIAEIFNLATQKLCGAAAYNTADSHQVLAVLAQRFGLEVCFGHREAVEYVESSVASHLRVCITTTEDRLWSYTTYPSEPFLSCAAAFLLHISGDALDAALNTLQTKVENGMIDIGQRGELVSRFLWLLAKDLFVLGKQEHGSTFARGTGEGFGAELIHCQMISVVDFFKFVFGGGFWDHVASDAKEAFTDAYVNFSHWVSMDANIRQEESDKRTLVQLG